MLRQLVDDNQLRLLEQRRLEIELQQRRAAILDFAPGQHVEPQHQRLGVGASMRLDVTDDHVDSLFADLAGRFQHGVRLTHARRGAEKHLELAAGLFGLGRFDAGQQGIRIGTFVVHSAAEFQTSLRQSPAPIDPDCLAAS